MNAASTAAPGSSCRKRVTLNSILIGIAILPFLPLTMAVESGCSAAQTAKVQTATAAVAQDAQSPAGQSILADVTSAALNAGRDVATGNDTGAIISGIQGAASAIRDYEGLPTAPSAATVANAAAAGSGVAQVATVVAPTLGTIISNALQSASAQKVSLSIDSIIEAAARGLDAVANAKVTQTSTARSICYAEPPCETLSLAALRAH